MNTWIVDRPNNTHYHHTRCQWQQSSLFTSNIYIQCPGGQNKWTCRNCHGESSSQNVWCKTYRTHILLKPKYSSDLMLYLYVLFNRLLMQMRVQMPLSVTKYHHIPQQVSPICKYMLMYRAIIIYMNFFHYFVLYCYY